MLQFLPNKENTAIQFIFNNFFTHELEFITAFDLATSEEIVKGLVETIEQINKEKNNGQANQKDKKSSKKRSQRS